MSNWENYKSEVQNVRDIIAAGQRHLYSLLDECKCEERVPKANYGPGSRFDKPTKTQWDECVVCMKMHNVKTLLNGEFKERRRKS